MGQIRFHAVATITTDCLIWVRNVRAEGMRVITTATGVEHVPNPQMVMSTTMYVIVYRMCIFLLMSCSSGAHLEARASTQFDTRAPYWAVLPRVHAPSITLAVRGCVVYVFAGADRLRYCVVIVGSGGHGAGSCRLQHRHGSRRRRGAVWCRSRTCFFSLRKQFE